MNIRRRESRPISAGGLAIGGEAPISVQTMTKTDTRDVAATRSEIARLAEAGADLVRLAVPDREAAEALGALVKSAPVPLAADIHFDYHLALTALDAGVQKLRINPGNIGGPDRVRAVALAAKDRRVPIRIGVNAGSLEERLIDKHGGPTPQAMVESALDQAALLEDLGFADIVVSLKASDVRRTVDAYRLIAGRCRYPLHLGVTEAGGMIPGTVKSSLGIGLLLAEGIGDTIRVSLTDDPALEVRVGFELLRALGLRLRGPEIVSCPTCGRCQVDLPGLVGQVEEGLKGLTEPVRVAVMGCAVNGPGEAREADFGLAGGKGGGLLFRRGQVVGKVPEGELAKALIDEVWKATGGRRPGG
ncbi:MAG TPA: flavodoxin-dependent (E)-4-hydroxy-3-methylbut-2-enyl-diphosphate synthase [Bacillota bacterium]|jgi:(E)-4-hydroxy-3-methylbut-2-enyl-diphosphate synthase